MKKRDPRATSDAPAVGGVDPFRNFLGEVFGSNVDTSSEPSGDAEECRYSLKKFMLKYLSHWAYSEFCSFHDDIFAELESLTFSDSKRKKFTAVASPRGHAKSTLVSKAYPLWLIYYKHESNIVLIADSVGQAEEYLDDTKGEIESNELLERDFGSLIGRRKWATGRIVTANGISVTAKGTGSKIRGINREGKRPGIFIMDDLENDEWVENPKIRKKLRSWLTKAVIPASSEQGKFFCIGTILHEDSLLNNLLTNTAFNYWKRFRYQAIQEFSDSPLWDEWQSLLENDEDKDCEKHAYEFYQLNRQEMLEGTESLWPDKSPDYFYDMMVQKVSDPDAFSSEYQNEPISPETQVFSTEMLDLATFDGEPPSPVKEIYIGVDPSLGKNQKGDPSAICAVARCEDNRLYVLEISAKRRKTEILVEDVFSMAIKYREKLKMINIEANGLQYLFVEQFEKANSEKGLYLPSEGINNQTNKEIKIESLSTKFKQGYLKIHKSLRRLRSELLSFPKGRTDDEMDSLCLAIGNIFTQAGGLSFGSIEKSKSAAKGFSHKLFNQRR